MAYKDRSYSEQTIQRVLYSHFKKMQYRMSNVYFFKDWECDFFFMTPTNFLWEIEIKVDRQDYTRDFQNKPSKHRLLKEAYETNNESEFLLPNCYYFCAPEGVIPPDTLPEYAGLIEIYDRDKVRYTSEVVNIHDKTRDVTTTLLKKFYNKSLKLESLLSKFRIDLFEADSEDEKTKIVNKFLKTIRM